MQQTFPCRKCRSQNIIAEPSCLACGESFKYTCPQCGVIVDTRFKARSNCGATLDWPIHDKVQPSRVAKKSTYQEQDRIGEEQRPKQKRASPVVIGGLIVIAVSFLAGLAMYIFSRDVPSVCSSAGCFSTRARGNLSHRRGNRDNGRGTASRLSGGRYSGRS